MPIYTTHHQPQVHTPFRRMTVFAYIASLIVLMMLATSPAIAIEKVPTKDLPKLTDIDNIKRFTGSVLVFRDDVAYDEVTFPMGKVVYENEKLRATKSLARSGTRTMLTYITPAGRSPLEVLRNYQQDLKAGGFKPLFECAEDDCGNASEFTGGNNFNFANILFKDGSFSTERGAAHVCAAGAQMTGFRYALLENVALGETLAVMTWRPLVKGYAFSCPDAIEQHTSVMVFQVKAKQMEQKMTLLSANEMSQSLASTGKVAIYGILFDTNKAEIKPESRASIEQIGALLKQQPALKLHVVGHTDNVGALTGNIDLSKRRADAVAAALAKDFGVTRDRLTANGVASLAPVASNANDAGRAKNRRVELVLQ
jgi:OmpA-OmpF porin, OOP family